MNKNASVKVYHGYGHTDNLIVLGHVFKNKAVVSHKFTNNILYNALQLLKLFFVNPLANAKLRLRWNEQEIYGTTEADGFFKFEFSSTTHVDAGWHYVAIDLLDEKNHTVVTGTGKIYVPNITQYAFISDIDDTIMVSHSATVFRRLKELFIRNPRTRSIFTNVAKHYELLALAHTNAATPNPFFYVSSSEWNLYDYLEEFFAFRGLPQGVFLLNQIKRWYELFKTGKTKHEGKLIRVMRIIDAFPNQRFILFGDNSQSDPVIYISIAEKYPEKVHAIFLRNIVPSHKEATNLQLAKVQALNIYTCIFNNSEEAIAYSKQIGLIT